MSSTQLRATTHADAYWTLDPLAVVRPGDPRIVDLTARLGATRYGIRKQLERELRRSPKAPTFVHFAVVGHGGAGKTTQVHQVMEELRVQKEVVPVFVDALDDFDQSSFTFSDFALVLVRTVAEALATQGRSIGANEAALVEQWFSEVLLTEEHRNTLRGELETQAEAKGGMPFFARLAVKVTASLKSDNEYRTEIRKRADRDVQDLLRRTNHFLDAAAKALGGDGRLTVVFDNLEKILDRRQVESALLLRAEDVRQLRCNVVLFLSPADQYNPGLVQAGRVFQVVKFPMLPVRTAEQPVTHVDKDVAGVLREILEKRIDLEALVADPDAFVHLLAQRSGGHLRDALQLARGSLDLADPEKATVEHLERAATSWSRNQVVLAVRPGDWARLAAIHAEKQIASQEADYYLAQHQVVLEYNGTGWWDVHPLAMIDARFKDAWKARGGLGP